MSDLIAPVVVAALTLAGVVFTAMMTRKSSGEQTSVTWYEKLTARLDAQDKRIDELSAELEEVKAERFSLRILVAALTDHIRAWRELFPDREQWPNVSAAVEDQVNKSD